MHEGRNKTFSNSMICSFHMEKHEYFSKLDQQKQKKGLAIPVKWALRLSKNKKVAVIAEHVNLIEILSEVYRVIAICKYLLEMVVRNITGYNEFEETVNKNDLVVLHFYAEWAAECGPMNEVIEELAKQTEYKDVKFAKIPAEDMSEVSLKYNVTAVPTFILLRNGKLVDRVNGANAAEVTKKINHQLQKGPHTPPEEPKEDLNTRLRKLICASPVMLFMKGTASEPRCGFSKTMVTILDSHNADYKTFDILQDEEVRQGLKTFSNWPTYPQLYINGELVGGLDIVREMERLGELKDMLPKKCTLEDRLKSLINRSECMVFMKGSREEPKCGFSKQLMEILSETGVEFETYDILMDEGVRQGLKELSKWPTYPQVYVKGELIGGLDIIKELKESGELIKTLKPQ